MDEWGNDLRARVITGCEVRCSRGVVWRGALELQEQSEARAAHTAFGSNWGALGGGGHIHIQLAFPSLKP